MKKTNLFVFLSVALLATATSLLADTPFEGKIRLQSKSGKTTQDIDYFVKGEKVRIQVQTSRGEMSGIMDSAKKEMDMFLPGQKMYLSVPMQDVMDAARKAQGDNDHLEKTGKTDTILGYKCEQYIYKGNADTPTELWLAEGLGSFQGIGKMLAGPRGSSRPMNAWEKEILDKGMFPLRVITRDTAGVEQSRLEATAVEKGPQADSLFTIPEGYTKLAMPAGLPGMLMPGGGK